MTVDGPARPGQYVTDTRAWRRQRQRWADRHADTSAVPDVVAERMFERLDLVRLPPGPILDLGCGRGVWTQRLQERFRDRLVVGVEPAPALARAAADRLRPRPAWWPSIRQAPALVCAELHRSPFRPGSFALIWSNLVLQWLPSPLAGWRDLGALLRPGGLLCFACPGPDTLRELAEAWRASGRASPVPAFADMHDLGDALLAAGFADPVMDAERLTVTYPDAQSLWHELRGQGAADARQQRPRGLMTPAALARVRAALDERIAVSLEVVQGHAWWPETGPGRSLEGLPVVSFQPRRKAS